MNRYLFSICFIILFGNQVHSQILVNYFNLSTHQSSIFLSFEIGAGNTCNGITIERSTDSLNFNPIYSFEGICGDPGFAVNYTWNDQNPVPNTKNYYRLNFGGTDFSQVYSIYLDQSGNVGYLLKNNSSNGILQFFLTTQANDDVVLYCYNGNAELMLKSEFENNSVFLDQNNLSSGIYYFIIVSSQNPVIKGKFFVE